MVDIIFKDTFYFILNSEFNAYLKQIKVILSTVKKMYFFTSDEYSFYFFTVAYRGNFNNLGVNFFAKRSGMHLPCLTLRHGCTHVK